jgi:alkylation response protein AidB-like acyl-CoA dehydrogenase
MLLRRTPDQEFLRETTAKYLDNAVPVGELRRLRDDPAGFDAGYWRQGAELGWTSLLVSDERGGGSISGNGLVDATFLAHEVGWHAAPGPFVSGNIAAAALGDAAGHDEVLKGVLSGEAVVAWGLAEAQPGGQFPEGVGCTAEPDGAELVLNGVKRPVESAGQATHVLVAGRTGSGLTQVLVPADAAGVTIEPMRTVDLTRRFCVVRLDDVRVPLDAVVGAVGGAAGALDRQLQLAVVLSAAESVGAMQRAFEMTVEWAFDRYSFGRPLASYQELKHRFADMKTWLEASHAITDAAATAVGAGAPNAAELVSAAKAYVGEFGAELVQDCVQLHGGIGVTFEHDLHLFVRRVTLNRALFGTPSDHRRRLADILERQEATP